MLDVRMIVQGWESQFGGPMDRRWQFVKNGQWLVEVGGRRLCSFPGGSVKKKPSGASVAQAEAEEPQEHEEKKEEEDEDAKEHEEPAEETLHEEETEKKKAQNIKTKKCNK